MANQLPPAYCALMQELLGMEEAESLFCSLEEQAPTSIRLSKSKSHLLPLGYLQGAKPVPWCNRGFYLPKRPIFTGQVPFHSGVFYVQEASSMLLAQIESLLGNEPLIALDLCAAPGGKSTLLLDIMPEGSVLLSNEVVRQRAYILSENLMKWGNPNHLVTNAYPDKLGHMSGAFDLILVDAPCSGEGMFRKDHNARCEWTEHSPHDCAERQRGILSDIWSALKPGGLMAYSTCTMNRLENEEILAYIIEELGAEPVSLGEIGSGVWTSPFSSYPCYRMMPHRTEGEGLFMAVVRKCGEDSPVRRQNKVKGKKPSKSPIIPAEVLGYIQHPEDYVFTQEGDELRAYPRAVATLVQEVQCLGIPLLSAGIPLATIKGKSLIPHTGLALSTELNPEAFPQIELEQVDVIPYLSREAIGYYRSETQGITLVSAYQIPLGFVKNLGNRCNNLYPQEWRIRHAHKL